MEEMPSPTSTPPIRRLRRLSVFPVTMSSGEPRDGDRDQHRQQRRRHVVAHRGSEAERSAVKLLSMLIAIAVSGFALLM